MNIYVILYYYLRVKADSVLDIGKEREIKRVKSSSNLTGESDTIVMS